MQLEQLRWTSDTGWRVIRSEMQDRPSAQLLLVFSDPDCLADPAPLKELQQRFPNARLVGGSTAGNVLGTTVSDNDIVATAVYLEKGRIRVLTADIENPADLRATTTRLADELQAEDLKHILLFCDGLKFNGSDVAMAVNASSKISATGGLMADKERFAKTRVVSDTSARENRLVLVGLYGSQLSVRSGCDSGWGEFGIDRVITRSKGNVVYEIDGQPALELYKTYLGKLAAELPSSGLRFPLSIRSTKEGPALIRTLLAVDEQSQSLVFAGDVPEGAISLLMKGKIDDLIGGARSAGSQAMESGARGPSLAVLISCVGRRLVMDQLTEEELDAVDDALQQTAWLTGFYSYGELAPHRSELLQCQLHNQTMTITLIAEA